MPAAPHRRGMEGGKKLPYMYDNRTYDSWFCFEPTIYYRSFSFRLDQLHQLMAVSPDWSKLGPESGPLRVVGFGINCHHFRWIIDVHLSWLSQKCERIFLAYNRNLSDRRILSIIRWQKQNVVQTSSGSKPVSVGITRWDAAGAVEQYVLVTNVVTTVSRLTTSVAWNIKSGVDATVATVWFPASSGMAHRIRPAKSAGHDPTHITNERAVYDPGLCSTVYPCNTYHRNVLYDPHTT